MLCILEEGFILILRKEDSQLAKDPRRLLLAAWSLSARSTCAWLLSSFSRKQRWQHHCSDRSDFFWWAANCEGQSLNSFILQRDLGGLRTLFCLGGSGRGTVFCAISAASYFPLYLGRRLTWLNVIATLVWSASRLTMGILHCCSTTWRTCGTWVPRIEGAWSCFWYFALQSSLRDQ